MKEIVKNNKLLVFLIALYVLSGLFILIKFDKGDFELLVNRNHDLYLDEFFFYITYIGDGRGSILILLMIFLRKNYYGFISTISFLSTTIVVQGMKRLVFSDYPRPTKFFEEKIQLHVIERLELHHWNSFPSGHSSGAFSIFIALCLVEKDKRWVWLYFGLAFLTAFSRVYLMQHFFIDTYAGALIGIVGAIMTYYYIHYKSSLKEKLFFQRPLLKSFDKK